MSLHKDVDQIDLLSGFDAVRALLHDRWDKSVRSEDIANLLTSMARDTHDNTQPLDIAQWSDWLDAVLSIRPDFNEGREAREEMQEEWQRYLQIRQLTAEAQQVELEIYRSEQAKHTWHRVGNCPITLVDAYEAMYAFVFAFWNRNGRRSGALDRFLRENASPGSPIDGAQWERWTAAVRNVRAKQKSSNDLLGKDIIAASLEELASRELQEKRWLSTGDGEVSSFTEVVEQLFTDSGLSDALKKGETGLPAEIEHLFRELDHHLSEVDATRPPAEIIGDPLMSKIREKSVAILRMLNM